MWWALIVLFVLILLVILMWVLQPFRNWKKNFDSRQYEPIIILDRFKNILNLQEYRIKNTSEIYLSVVIPSYNQEERLPLMLNEAAAHLQKCAFTTEFIVVNDGSKDNTTTVALECGKKLKINVVVIEYPKNRGKGGAVRAGMAVAKGKYILMVDADGATTFSQLDKVLKNMVENEAHNELVMVVGSRRQQEQKVKRKLHRQFVSFVFSFVIRTLLGIKNKDTQCGFKMFNKEAKEVLFTRLHIERFAFDVELFFLCNKFKVCIGEVGVQWRDIDGSKLNVLDASVNMFRDVLMIRIYYLLGLWSTTDRVSVK